MNENIPDRKEAIASLVQNQRIYFQSGATLTVQARIRSLKTLQTLCLQNETRMLEALHADLGKSDGEGYMCEFGLVLSEIRYLLRHIRSFAREKRVHTPLAQFCSRSYQKPCPYGVTLIMSPWNYPLLLTMEPLADALAAGNTAIIKSSAYAPATSELLQELIASAFPPELVTVVTGGREENRCLLDEKFDYIFFTGSKSVGTAVLEKAAKYVTPVTLELGGKSPCIVDETADIKLAAKRIVFGKFLNCGQTCVAPDYILCHRAVKSRFLAAVKKEIAAQYPSDYRNDPDYGKIVNEKHFHRLLALIDADKVVWGGEHCRETLQIQPTVLDHVTWHDAVMQEEIFGPILPILTFDSIKEVIQTVNSHDTPLALYLFSGNSATIRQITAECAYGGGCINDVVIHLATSHMGFGGMGESGMGAYHGKAGFDTFTHYKSIVWKKTWIDLPMRYRPYTERKKKTIRKFLK